VRSNKGKKFKFLKNAQKIKKIKEFSKKHGFAVKLI